MNTSTLKQDQDLWQRIKDFSIDQPDALFPFSRKLAKEENWTPDFTKKAIEEYKKFVYLCCILPNGASPSETVDKVWHMHLIYTQNYWEEFCPRVLKRKLHHHPSNGGSSENIRHRNWFSETLKSYREVFQQEAPNDIWYGKEKSRSGTTWFKKLRIIPLFLALFMLSSCLGEVWGTLTSALLPITGIFVFFRFLTLSRSDDGNIHGKKKDDGNTGGSGDGGCSSSGCSGGGSCSSGCGGGCGGCGGGCGG